MKTTLVDRESFWVLGTATKIVKGSETPELFSGIWQDFERRLDEIASLSLGTCYYGVSFTSDVENVIEYVAGMVVEEERAVVPKGLVMRRIKESRFVVFSCRPEKIGPTYKRIFSQWLSRLGHELNPFTPVFECYPPAGETGSPVRIHVPVK